jgi:hypothetical protein
MSDIRPIKIKQVIVGPPVKCAITGREITIEWYIAERINPRMDRTEWYKLYSESLKN